MYLLSRILFALSRLAVEKGFIPKPKHDPFPLFATLVWGIVLWLFEFYPHTLQPSLQSSMNYLYHDSNVWHDISDFLVYNKPRTQKWLLHVPKISTWNCLAQLNDDDHLLVIIIPIFNNDFFFCDICFIAVCTVIIFHSTFSVSVVLRQLLMLTAEFQCADIMVIIAFLETYFFKNVIAISRGLYTVTQSQIKLMFDATQSKMHSSFKLYFFF